MGGHLSILKFMESLELLKEGIVHVVSKWTIIVLAIENEWGGPNTLEKLDNFKREIFVYLTEKSEHFVDELEMFLDDSLIHYFMVYAEDDSPHQVATTLIQLYSELSEEIFTTFNFVRSLRTSDIKSS